MSCGKVVRAFCDTHCDQKCGVFAYVENGKIVKVEPASFPDERAHALYEGMCLKGKALPQLVHHPGRLRYPLKKVKGRGKSRWKRISWDHAFDIVAREFSQIAKKNGSESVGLIKGAGTLGLLSQAPLRLWNLFQGSRIIGGVDSAGPQALEDMLGTPGGYTPPSKQKVYGGWKFGSNEITDCFNSNMVIIWGSNPAVTSPRSMRFLLAAKSKGTRLVVIDPRRTSTASSANSWIKIKPGTDAALALGVMNVILKNDLADESFIKNHTVGPFLVRNDNRLFLREHDVLENGSERPMVWDPKREEAVPYTNTSVRHNTLTGTYDACGIRCTPAFQLLKERILQFPPEKVEDVTSVDKEEIINLAMDYASNKPSAIYLYFGLDRWYYANIAYRSIFTLPTLTGQFGSSGGGLQLGGGAGKAKRELHLGTWLCPTDSRHAIFHTVNAYDAHARAKIKALWICAANVFRFPNENKWKEFLDQLEFIVLQSVFWIPGAEYADVILPACTCLEKIDFIPSPFPYVQLQQKAIDPLYESKSDLQITSELARRMGFGGFFDKNPEEYLKSMLKGTGISFKKLKKEGVAKIEPLETPFIEFKNKRFPTDSGRVEFYVERDVNSGQELPIYIESKEGPNGNRLAEKYPLVFLQCHSQFHVHTSFAKIPMLRKIDPEPVLEINPKDAKKRDIKNGDMVLVFNDRGKVKLKTRIQKEIGPGVVNIDHGWWPDQFEEGSYQCLTPDKTNPSLTSPNFSYYDCLVEVRKVA